MTVLIEARIANLTNTQISFITRYDTPPEKCIMVIMEIQGGQLSENFPRIGK